MKTKTILFAFALILISAFVIAENVTDDLNIINETETVDNSSILSDIVENISEDFNQTNTTELINQTNTTELFNQSEPENYTKGENSDVTENITDEIQEEIQNNLSIVSTVLSFIKESIDEIMSGTFRISAKLSYENDTGIPNQEILFFNDGKYLDSNITNLDGIASILINDSNYSKITASFNGSEYLMNSSIDYFFNSIEDNNIEVENESGNIEEYQGIIVSRSSDSDTYYVGSGKYKTILYDRQVNIMDLSGVYRPYEEITNFSFDKNKLLIEWNNKTVELKINFQDENSKKISTTDSELNFKTKIEKNRGRYYFDHRMNDSKNVKKITYEISTNNVEDCFAKGNSLICDEQEINFEEAFLVQGLNVTLSKNKIEISGEDLSYVDPEITPSSYSSMLQMLKNCDGNYVRDNGNSMIGFRDTGSGYEERNIYFYSTSSIPDDAEIESIIVNGYMDDIKDSDCESDAQLRFKNMDYNDVGNWYDDSDSTFNSIWSAMSNWGEYGSILGLSDSDDNSYFSKNLGTSSISKMEGLLASDEPFVFGISGSSDFSVCDSKYCYTSIGSVSLEIVYTAYPSDLEINVGNYTAWNFSGRFEESEEIDLADSLNSALEDCVADELGYCDIPVYISSETTGVLSISDPEIYFNSSEYTWNSSGLFNESAYIRILAFDGIDNSSWNFIEVFKNIESLFDFIGNNSYSVASFFENGLLRLKGSCFESSNCVAPNNSMIFQDSDNTTVAYIDFEGNLCLEGNNCSNYAQSSCNPVNDAFIVQDSESNNVSYIDFEGNLCLMGRLIENA